MLQFPCCARDTDTFEHVNHATCTIYVMLSLSMEDVAQSWCNMHCMAYHKYFINQMLQILHFVHTIFWNVHAYTDWYAWLCQLPTVIYRVWLHNMQNTQYAKLYFDVYLVSKILRNKKLISMQQAMSIHSNQNCLVKMYSIENSGSNK